MKKIFAVIGLMIASTAGADSLSEDQVRAIVKDMIAENGALIAEAMEQHLMAQRQKAVAAMITPDTPVIGDDSATVTVIEFSDYRCGYCRRVQETLNQLRADYAGQVRFAFKQLPILSRESQQAAAAGLAAQRQGKFWEYHEKLWDNQSRLSSDLFTEIATEIGLDVTRFKNDMASATVLNQIATDRSQAQQFGAEGTPFFLIDGEPFGGAQPYENFKRAIDSALAARQG